MGVTATVELPLDTLPLGKALRGFPDSHIRIDRTIPTGDEFLPYIWTDAETVEAITDQLERETAVETCSVVDILEDKALVRVEWSEPQAEFLEHVQETGGLIQEAICTETGWTMTIRFDDHADLGECYRNCVEDGIEITATSLQRPTPNVETEPTTDLTETQWQALVEAYESGYFEVPRNTDLDDLADRLDISDTAVSQRIRRGTHRLVEHAIQFPDDKTNRE